jgi:hypothetical protein
MPAPMRRWLSASIWAALSGWGCSDPRLIDGVADGATLIRVAPSAFVGSVACVQGASGALQSYAVKLQRVDAAGQLADGGLANGDLQISPPVPCDRAVVFPALPDRSYAAEISGYDQAITEAEASTVAPRWTSICGRGGGVPDAGLDPLGPIQAVRSATVPLRGCTQFENGGSEASRLLVDTTGALGALRCGAATGQVAFFEARLQSSSARAACGQPLSLPVTGPAAFQTLDLTAFEASFDAGVPGGPDAAAQPGPVEPLDAGSVGDAALDAATSDPGSPGSGPDAGGATAPDGGAISPELVGVARWRTQCIGRSLPGVANPTTCDPLVPIDP